MSYLRNVANQVVRAGLTTAATGAPFAGPVTCYVTVDTLGQFLGQTNAGVCAADGNGQFRYTATAAEMNGSVCSFDFVGTGAVGGVVVTIAPLTPAQATALTNTTYLQTQVALDIITDALVEIGAYAPGETIAPVHAQLGLLRLQHQLDTWQADALTLNLQDRDVFVLTPGMSQFMVGPTGDLVTDRPNFIAGISYLIPGTTPATEVPMAPMDDEQFMGLSQKTLPATLPQQYYVDATWPNATIHLWPQVTQTVSVVLYLRRGIGVPATLTTAVTGPQGYAEGFMYQLALRLCGPMSRPMPADLPAMAAAAYGRLKRPNVEVPLMALDAALTAHGGGGGFNVLTGQTSGASNR